MTGFILWKDISEKSKTHPDDTVDFAVDYLRDNALTTFRSLNDEYMHWEHFKIALRSNFQPKNLQKCLRQKLSVLKQTNSVQEYIYAFDTIMNQIKDMSEVDKVDRFTQGLTQEICQKVGYEEPATLIEAKEIALRIDAYFNISNRQQNDKTRYNSYHKDSMRSPKSTYKNKYNNKPYFKSKQEINVNKNKEETKGIISELS